MKFPIISRFFLFLYIILIFSCSKEIKQPRNIRIVPPYAVSKSIPDAASLYGLIKPEIPEGFPQYLLSVYDGTVIKSDGSVIIIQHMHNGAFFYSLYAQASQLSVTKGDYVSSGELLGFYSSEFNFKLFSLDTYEKIEDLNRFLSVSNNQVRLHFGTFEKKSFLNIINHRPQLIPVPVEIMSLQFEIKEIVILNPCINPQKLSMVMPVQHIIEEYTHHDVRTIHYTEEEQYANPDALIITGQSTPWEKYDMSDFSWVKDIIESGGTPVLGICGGHQLITILSGGTVGLVKADSCDKTSGYRGCYKVKGFVNVEFDTDEILFTGYSSPAEFYASHCEHVTELPDSFSIIAQTPFSPVYAFKKNETNIYGIQFHPELPANDNIQGRNILLNFCLLY